MSKEYLQKLVTSEQHLRHVVLELAAKHLENNAEDIIGSTLYTYDYSPEDDPEEYAEQERAIEVYELFAEPSTRAVRRLAKELKAQATDLAKTCICYWPDDERVYPAMSALLEQLPLPISLSYCRDDDEGYRLVVNDDLIFEHLGPDEAIEATRQYVEARTYPAPPLDRKGELN